MAARDEALRRMEEERDRATNGRAAAAAARMAMHKAFVRYTAPGATWPSAAASSGFTGVTRGERGVVEPMLPPTAGLGKAITGTVVKKQSLFDRVTGELGNLTQAKNMVGPLAWAYGGLGSSPVEAVRRAGITGALALPLYGLDKGVQSATGHSPLKELGRVVGGIGIAQSALRWGRDYFPMLTQARWQWLASGGGRLKWLAAPLKAIVAARPTPTNLLMMLGGAVGATGALGGGGNPLLRGLDWAGNVGLLAALGKGSLALAKAARNGEIPALLQAAKTVGAQNLARLGGAAEVAWTYGKPFAKLGARVLGPVGAVYGANQLADEVLGVNVLGDIWKGMTSSGDPADVRAPHSFDEFGRYVADPPPVASLPKVLQDQIKRFSQRLEQAADPVGIFSSSQRPGTGSIAGPPAPLWPLPQRRRVAVGRPGTGNIAGPPAPTRPLPQRRRTAVGRPGTGNIAGPPAPTRPLPQRNRRTAAKRSPFSGVKRDVRTAAGLGLGASVRGTVKASAPGRFPPPRPRGAIGVRAVRSAPRTPAPPKAKVAAAGPAAPQRRAVQPAWMKPVPPTTKKRPVRKRAKAAIPPQVRNYVQLTLDNRPIYTSPLQQRQWAGAGR